MFNIVMNQFQKVYSQHVGVECS